jgi:hypothetical protein
MTQIPAIEPVTRRYTDLVILADGYDFIERNELCN